MESYILDWANLLLRWLHVITAIAWVGSSFYFVFLDSSLTPPVDEDLKKQGVSGELWALHGGGFYHPVKFAGAPPKLPEHTHWFFWESYTTWLSGFALLTVSYLWNANIYLVNPANPVMSSGMAIVVALSFLVVFWLLYNGICRIFGEKESGDGMVGALVLVLVCVASYLACPRRSCAAIHPVLASQSLSRPPRHHGASAPLRAAPHANCQKSAAWSRLAASRHPALRGCPASWCACPLQLR